MAVMANSYISIVFGSSSRTEEVGLSEITAQLLQATPVPELVDGTTTATPEKKR